MTARIRPVVRTNSGDTCRASALQGRCIVLQPSFLVGPDLQFGDLVELMPGYPSLGLGIDAHYPSGNHLLSKVRLLIDFLVDWFAKRP